MNGPQRLEKVHGSITRLENNLNTMSVHIKYMQFDLEATVRERDSLKKELDAMRKERDMWRARAKGKGK